jgi:peptidylprolyl isomerase
MKKHIHTLIQKVTHTVHPKLSQSKQFVVLFWTCVTIACLIAGLYLLLPQSTVGSTAVSTTQQTSTFTQLVSSSTLTHCAVLYQSKVYLANITTGAMHPSLAQAICGLPLDLQEVEESIGEQYLNMTLLKSSWKLIGDLHMTKNTQVALETTKGTITLELFSQTMPLTAGNFERLVRKGFYDGVIFHRVIPQFMIQGGDPTGTGMGGPGYTIKDEFSKPNKNVRGTLSMANAGPNTGGSQFFINTVNNSFLDTKHPVFAKVISGMDVVDAISEVERNRADKPLVNVTITKATVIE